MALFLCSSCNSRFLRSSQVHMRFPLRAERLAPVRCTVLLAFTPANRIRDLKRPARFFADIIAAFGASVWFGFTAFSLHSISSPSDMHGIQLPLRQYGL